MVKAMQGSTTRPSGFLLLLLAILFLSFPNGAFASASAAPAEKDAADEEEEGEGESSDLEDLLKEFEAEEEAGKNSRPDYDKPLYDYLRLGVNESYLKQERFRLHDQILTFIPPLYQPAFVGHGYVLPPNTWRVAFSGTFLDVEPDDFFKNGEVDIVHENHRLERFRLDLDIFYGMDRDFTLRLNLPFHASQSKGSVHPAGVLNMDLFAEGATSQVGDATLFLKKKFWDQANLWFNFAGVVGVKFPTGSNDEKFDRPMVVRDPMGNLGAAFNGGPFQRFTDDGRLPSGLQPGTGGFGYNVGLFGTRQFIRHRAAVHVGFLARFLDDADGVEPGDELRFFASYVKPIYKDFLSVELAINGMDKKADRYEGQFLHPIPDPATGLFAGTATTPRPSFREGTIVFASPSIIIIPNPWLRFSATGMIRLNEPKLGPWPDSQLVFNLTSTF